MCKSNSAHRTTYVERTNISNITCDVIISAEWPEWESADEYVFQWLSGAGGGERKGMEGMLVGIDGMPGSGGRVTFGMVGMVFGRLGSGGSAVGLGRVGCTVGRVGRVG